MSQKYLPSKRKEIDIKAWWKANKNRTWHPEFDETILVVRQKGLNETIVRRKKKVFDPFYGGHSFI